MSTLKKTSRIPPEPLALIQERKVWELRGKHIVPEPMPERWSQAAQAWAHVNDSDPWAGARMALHLRRGLVIGSDVFKDAMRLQKARLNEPRYSALTGERVNA